VIHSRWERVPVCVCVHRSEVNLECLSSGTSFLLVLFCFWENLSLTLIWGPLIKTGWLVSEFLGYVWLPLPSIGNTSMNHHTWLFVWLWGLDSGLPACHSKYVTDRHLPAPPHPPSMYFIPNLHKRKKTQMFHILLISKGVAQEPPSCGTAGHTSLTAVWAVVFHYLVSLPLSHYQ